MNGWSPKDVTLAAGKVVAASQSNEPISADFSITAGGSKNIVVAVKLSAVTAGAGVTIKLQTAINGTYFDSKTASVTDDGFSFIKLNVQTADDQEFLPLLDVGRVVITTGGSGATATIDQVSILQEL